jgi:hypothetical protein
MFHCGINHKKHTRPWDEEECIPLTDTEVEQLKVQHEIN